MKKAICASLKILQAIAKTLLTKGYALTEETLEQSKQFIKDSVEQLNQIRMWKRRILSRRFAFLWPILPSVRFWHLYWLFRERRGSGKALSQCRMNTGNIKVIG